MLAHGYETGIIYQLPNGEYIEVHAPLPEDKRAELEARLTSMPPLEAGADDDSGVPNPVTRGPVGKLRLALNRVVTESIPLPVGNGHGTNGHGSNGHGEPAAVTSGEEGKTLLGQDSPEDPSGH